MLMKRVSLNMLRSYTTFFLRMAIQYSGLQASIEPQVIILIVKIYDDPGSIQPAAGITLLGCFRLTNAIKRGLKYLLFVDSNGTNTMQLSTTSLLHPYYQHADFSGICSMPSSKQPCQVLIEIIVLYWSYQSLCILSSFYFGVDYSFLITFLLSSSYWLQVMQVDVWF